MAVGNIAKKKLADKVGQDVLNGPKVSWLEKLARCRFMALDL